MEGPLALPHEMPCVGLLEPGSPVLVKRSRCVAPLPQRMYAVVDGTSFRSCAWMPKKNAQQAGKAREIAVDDPLQVWHLASAPVIELLRREQAMAMRTSTGVTTLPLARRPATARSTRGKSASLRKEATLTQDARKAGSRVERVGDLGAFLCSCMRLGMVPGSDLHHQLRCDRPPGTLAPSRFPRHPGLATGSQAGARWLAPTTRCASRMRFAMT